MSAEEGRDHQALAEIDLCGELMIAAAASEEPLSAARIDEVLGVRRALAREPRPRKAMAREQVGA